MRWLVALLMCATVATCGQKGPLRLPDDQQAVAEPVRHAV
ncbi:MAG: lipoprotein [Gammaproteobacteria bacterium]|nr:lipoprotein [Gammaproteobacteria bacterium]